MMREIVFVIVIMTLLSACKDGDKRKFEQLRTPLREFVEKINVNWANGHILEKQTYPYIIIRYNDIFQKNAPFYVDSNELLLIDDSLQDILIALYKERGVKSISFYELNTIEFVLERDVSMFRDKSTGFLFCENDCNNYREIQKLESNWFSFERSVSY